MGKSDNNWLYVTSFDIDSTELARHEHYQLTLDGVDTFAEVLYQWGSG